MRKYRQALAKLLNEILHTLHMWMAEREHIHGAETIHVSDT